jgi:hypothetical protein
MVNNITKRKTRRDWAFFLEKIANQYEREEKIALVMDNLSTCVPGSFYETFQPDKQDFISKCGNSVLLSKFKGRYSKNSVYVNIGRGFCIHPDRFKNLMHPMTFGKLNSGLVSFRSIEINVISGFNKVA